MVEWDETKRHSNRTLHGVDFEAVARFDWSAATTQPDLRHDYGEERFVAVGPIDGRLHVLIYTRRGSEMRVISLRKANARERQRWDASGRSS